MAQLKLNKFQVQHFKKESLWKCHPSSKDYRKKMIQALLFCTVLLLILIYFKQWLFVPIFFWFVYMFFFKEGYNEYFLNEMEVELDLKKIQFRNAGDEFRLCNSDLLFVQKLEKGYYYYHKLGIAFFLPDESISDSETAILNALSTKYPYIA